MRKLKKSLLMCAALLLTLNIVTICADDGSTDTYTATFEFVSDDGTELPEEVLYFLPEPITGLQEGDVIEAQPQPDIRTNDNLYHFISWDEDVQTIGRSDVSFTGTWEKKECLKNELLVVEEHFSVRKQSEAKTYQTLRWDDFGAACYATYEDGTIFYPSLYFVANERDNNGRLKDRKICFCVQHDFAFYKGTNTSYDVYDIEDYPLLSESNKTKIVRIASFALKQDGMYWRDASSSQSGKWMNIEEALAAQIAIWMVIADDSNTPSHRRLTIQESGSLDRDYINSRASYYYNTVANRESTEGIDLEQSSYSGTVGQVFRVGTVDDPSIAEIVLSDGIVFCNAEGKIASTVQWDGRYFYIKATKPVTDAIQTVTALPSGQQEALFLQHPSSQNIVMAGALVSRATFQVTAKQLQLSVRKTAAQTAFDYLKECPNNYSLAGAVYGVYRDMPCTEQIATLTTDEEGKSEKVGIAEEGTYYVKEIVSSPGYTLDAKTYTAVISGGNETVISSVEPPLNDPIRFVLTKKNATDQTKRKYLDTAEFTLKYYDTQEDDISHLEAKYEWTFKTEYSETGEAEVVFDQQHFVKGSPLLLNDYGDFYLPLGTFTIQETKAPQTYLIDENVYVGHIVKEDEKAIIRFVGEEGWEYLKVANERLIQTEREAIGTKAYFKENGEDHYPADGFVTVMDEVRYECLIPEQSYTLLTKLVDKETEEIVLTSQMEFTPAKEKGNVLVELGEMDLTKLAGKSYVCYEYLYVTEEIKGFTNDISELDEESLREHLLTYHEDLEDEDQTIHVDELYSAAFVLYKIGDNQKENKLSGAYFHVATKRTRRDGTVVEKDLGTFVTGGIYVEDDEAFTLEVYRDKAMTDKAGSYGSEWNDRFRKHAVSILDLEKGTYYVRKDLEESCSIYRVAKGMIYLPDQEEDTQITFQELAAPMGYAIEMKPFTMTVGHDDSVKTVENYRSNYLLYIPVTGRDA